MAHMGNGAVATVIAHDVGQKIKQRFSFFLCIHCLKEKKAFDLLHYLSERSVL